MKTITKDELLKIAKLSMLDLNETEIPVLTKHISDVLAYAARVKEVASIHEEPTEPYALFNVVRDDVAVQTNVQAIMAQAPEQAEHFFVVPHILEGQ